MEPTSLPPSGPICAGVLARLRMTESDLGAALRPLAAAFRALGVPFYLGGSVASSAHGIARASLDADVIAALEPAHVEPLLARLGSAYYIPVDRLREAVAERASCNFIHLDTMFKIDVFVSKGRPFDRGAFERSREEALDETASALRVPIASPEDTILAKLEWFRRGGEVSERQWWDIVGVLRVNADLDRNYLAAWAQSLGVADLLQRALADAAN
jgi:hypothetical protein